MYGCNSSVWSFKLKRLSSTFMWFIMLYKEWFKLLSVDETLVCYHSNESYWAQLSCGTSVSYAAQGSYNLCIYGWSPSVWPLKKSLYILQDGFASVEIVIIVCLFVRFALVEEILWTEICWAVFFISFRTSWCPSARSDNRPLGQIWPPSYSRRGS